MTELANMVKIPTAAPRIRDWFVQCEEVISEACDRLGIGRNADDSFEESRIVGLAGPGGAGKSTVASMIIAREDVRASFCKGVLWLQVGQGAKDRLPKLMTRLAEMVYETVLRKTCRPPIKKGFKTKAEDGVAYIREAADESSRNFLVLADDVWEAEVLEELKRVGAWVLYTSRKGNLLPTAPAIRLDQVRMEEAEMVLRKAADLDNDAPLPEAAYDLMERCEFVAQDLSFIGRWGMVREKKGERAWRTVLDVILEAQKGDEGRAPVSWRAAVLRAGIGGSLVNTPTTRSSTSRSPSYQRDYRFRRKSRRCCYPTMTVLWKIRRRPRRPWRRSSAGRFSREKAAVFFASTTSTPTLCRQGLR